MGERRGGGEGGASTRDQCARWAVLRRACSPPAVLARASDCLACASRSTRSTSAPWAGLASSRRTSPASATASDLVLASVLPHGREGGFRGEGRRESQGAVQCDRQAACGVARYGGRSAAPVPTETSVASPDERHGPAVGPAGRESIPATCRVERGFARIGKRQLGTGRTQGWRRHGPSADAGASHFSRCADSCALASARSERRRTFSALRAASSAKGPVSGSECASALGDLARTARAARARRMMRQQVLSSASAHAGAHAVPTRCRHRFRLLACQLPPDAGDLFCTKRGLK